MTYSASVEALNKITGMGKPFVNDMDTASRVLFQMWWYAGDMYKYLLKNWHKSPEIRFK